MKFRYIFWSFVEWLEDHSPVWCVRCSSVYFKKDMTYHTLTWKEKPVPLCKSCRKDMFEPFSRKEDV